MPGLPGTASIRPLLQADLPECLFHADLGKFNWELIFVTKKILLMFCAQLQLQQLEVWMRGEYSATLLHPWTRFDLRFIPVSH